MSENKLNAIDIGFGVIGSGLALGVAYPGVLSSLVVPTAVLSTPVLLCGAGAVGCGYGIYKILTKDKRESKENFKANCEAWELFWNDNKIVSHELCPKFMYDILDNNKRTIAFELPYGIYESDINKISNRIKSTLDIKNLDINIRGDKLYLNSYILNDNQNEWLEFWESINIKNPNGICPKLTSDEYESENIRVIKFNIPKLLLKSKLENCKQLLLDFIGEGDCDMNISKDTLTVTIKKLTELEKRYYNLFQSIGVCNRLKEYPKFIESISIPHGIRYVYSLPNGLHVNKLENNESAIINTLKCKEVNFDIDNECLYVDAMTEAIPDIIPYKKHPVTDKSKLEIVFGENLDGIHTNIFDEANGHALISGGSGGGKSNAVRVFFCNLAENYGREYVRLWIGDFKEGVEMYPFEHLKITDRYSDVDDDIFQMILDLKEEMDNRYKEFKKVRANDIRVYNSKVESKNRIPRIVFFVDEINTLYEVNSSHLKGDIKKRFEEVLSAIDSLGQKARACGIHVVTSIQRPDSKTFSPKLKANLKTRYCLPCADETNSEIILGKGDFSGAKIKKAGRAIIKNEEGKSEIQTYYIPHEELDDILYPYLTDIGKKIVDEDRKLIKELKHGKNR